MSITTPAQPSVRPVGTPHRPSSLGYWIGGGLIAAACIGAAVWAVLAFFGYVNQVNGFQRMTMPGTAIVHVSQPTTRVLYYESTGAAPSLAQLGIHVTGPAGNAVGVIRYSGDLRYDVPPLDPARAGKAIASFDATAAGNYTISARPALGTGGDDRGRQRPVVGCRAPHRRHHRGLPGWHGRRSRADHHHRGAPV
jgi:hypothetical protein